MTTFAQTHRSTQAPCVCVSLVGILSTLHTAERHHQDIEASPLLMLPPLYPHAPAQPRQVGR